MATQRRNSIFMFSQSHAKGSSPRIQGLGPGLDRVPCGYPKAKLNFHFGPQSRVKGVPKDSWFGPGAGQGALWLPKGETQLLFLEQSRARGDSYHQSSSIAIKRHRSYKLSSITIKRHQSSSSVINDQSISIIIHCPPSIIHQLSCIIRHPSPIIIHHSSMGSSFIIHNHQPSIMQSLIIITNHCSSSSTIRSHHQLSPEIINSHSSSSIINHHHHHRSSISINLHPSITNITISAHSIISSHYHSIISHHQYESSSRIINHHQTSSDFDIDIPLSFRFHAQIPGPCLCSLLWVDRGGLVDDRGVQPLQARSP